MSWVRWHMEVLALPLYLAALEFYIAVVHEGKKYFSMEPDAWS